MGNPVFEPSLSPFVANAAPATRPITTSEVIAAITTRPRWVLWIATALPVFLRYRRYMAGNSSASVKHDMIR